MIRSNLLAQYPKACLAVLFATSLIYSGFSVAAPVKVAFTGDQGAGEGARAVLSLIASEGADLLLVQGDLGYDDGKASTWEENLTQALGADFPVLTLVGNHENFEWPLYQRYIQQRIDRVDELSCSGETGVKAICQFRGIEIVQVSPGIHEVDGVNGDENYAEFIASSFAESAAPWRICAWHKNQNKMQTGSKSDATGWGVYDACLDAGAMIALAHEHAYSRTHLLSDFKNQKVAHKNSDMTLEPGKSFAVVSGLGGREVRDQVQGGDWWASIYTGSQGATHGALFCTFDEATASCYFKAIDGAEPDRFTLKTKLGSNPAVSGSEPAVNQPGVQEPVPEGSDLPATEVAEAGLSESQPVNPENDIADTPSAAPPLQAGEWVDPDIVAQNEAAVPDTGPLTVVDDKDTDSENTSLSSDLNAEPVATALPVEGSAITDGAGNFSLLLLMALAAQYGWRKRRLVRNS